MEKKVIVRDIYLSAHLLTCGVTPNLEKQGGTVVFVFDKDDKFYELSNRFNCNEPIPVADYVHHLKALRNMMYTLKGNGGT